MSNDHFNLSLNVMNLILTKNVIRSWAVVNFILLCLFIWISELQTTKESPVMRVTMQVALLYLVLLQIVSITFLVYFKMI